MEESGFYRLYRLVDVAGHLSNLEMVHIGPGGTIDAGGYYNPANEGSPAQQVVAAIEAMAKDRKWADFYWKPGYYVVMPERYTQTGNETSFYVKQEEVEFSNK